MDTIDIPPSVETTGTHTAHWSAVTRRDATADGRFVYSVRTTGVYCRPSCASRPARPENVAFHATCADAEQAGFRPCKRCRPNDISQARRHAVVVAKACELIDQAETMPSLEKLAAAVNLSAYHFHRVFKTATGVTPRAYASQRRATRVAATLRSAETITNAVYDAGFNAASRFYEAAPGRLGMTPTTYREGGAGVRIRSAVSVCTFGAILVAATDKGICAILLGDNPEALSSDLRDSFPNAEIIDDDHAFEAIVALVVAFVEEPRKGLDLPLDIAGTAFQQRVWDALRSIPAGTTVTYSEIAAVVGSPRAVRAVGSACAANKLAVAIPCHRVVPVDGSRNGGGYRWGVERKRDLMARERSQR